mgnify:FL=1
MTAILTQQHIFAFYFLQTSKCVSITVTPSRSYQVRRARTQFGDILTNYTRYHAWRPSAKTTHSRNLSLCGAMTKLGEKTYAGCYTQSSYTVPHTARMKLRP